MTVLELREKAAEEAQLARDIKDKCDQEGRGMNTDEAVDFDKHLVEAQRLEQEAIRQEKLEEVEARMQKAEPRKTTPELTTGEKIDKLPATARRYGNLRSFKGPRADVEAFRSGQWLLATIGGNARAQEYCRRHGIELRVQTESINTAGGFVVPDEMERTVIDMREEYGNARRNARIVPMSTDHMVIPRRSGGVTAYFLGETTEITASDKSWNQVELTAKKLGALTRMSSDLSEDAVINIADDLADEMAYAFAVKEDQCAIDGTGTATFGGMIGIRTKMVDGNHVGSYVDNTANGDNWSEITDAMLLAVMAALPLYARRRAKWHCSPLAKVAVFDRLILAAGGATMRERVEGTYRAQYMGYPIEEWPAMPTADAAAALNNLIMLFFGDFGMSTTLGTRRGITIKKSEERYLEFDQIGIQATERFCIVNHDIGGAAGVRGPVVGMLGGT